MNITEILENLRRLSNIYNFISLLEVKFMHKTDLLSLSKATKKILEKSLVDLAFDIEEKLQSNRAKYSSHFSTNSITHNIQESLQSIKTITIKEEIPNSQLLIKDLENIIIFCKKYENSTKINYDPKDKDLLDLKRNCLEIIAERFG